MVLSRIGTFLLNILLILRIGATPISFIYPIPLASIIAASLTGFNFTDFVVSYLFCFVSFTASNLWNHINDLEEDIVSGRKQSLFLAEHLLMAKAITVSFYLFVPVIFILFSYDFRTFPLLILCIILNWMYSDKILLGRKIRRLKEYYLTELATYILLIPAFFTVLWTFFSPLSPKAFIFSTILTVFYLSGAILKDLKDISSDENSGYKTLGVVFTPESLLKCSVLLNIFGNIVILIFSLSGILPNLCALSSLPLVLLLYLFWKLNSLKWTISESVLPLIKMYPYSYFTSLSLIPLLVFISSS